MKSEPSLLSRRSALLAWLAATACGRRLGKRYQGWLVVASGAGRSLAVADLAAFRRMTTIPLPAAPDQLFHTADRVYATSREGAALLEIDPATLKVSARINLGGRPVAARLLPDGKSALLALDEPAALVTVDLAKRKVAARLPLPGAPADFDVSDAPRAAVTLPSAHAILRMNVAAWKIEGVSDVAATCGPVRFRNDGKTILAGAPSTREILTLDAESGRVLARLPLPLAPSRFSFNPDGGQMFVTGAGRDTVVIVNPYQNEVAETILAGRTPHAMAVSPKSLLFVTNFESGDLTIIDIATRHLSAAVHTGGNPGEVLLTPDGEYALVVDRASGNVSVLRISTVLDLKGSLPSWLSSEGVKPLFTVFPTATDVRSAMILPRPA